MNIRRIVWQYSVKFYFSMILIIHVICCINSFITLSSVSTLIIRMSCSPISNYLIGRWPEVQLVTNILAEQSPQIDSFLCWRFGTTVFCSARVVYHPPTHQWHSNIRFQRRLPTHIVFTDASADVCDRHYVFCSDVQMKYLSAIPSLSVWCPSTGPVMANTVEHPGSRIPVTTVGELM